jgi:hypothetical protein
MYATKLWSVWLSLLLLFRPAFTAPGHRRFVQWATGLILTLHDHTLTQTLLGIDQPHDWKALERFVEHGAWDQLALERLLAQRLAQLPDRLWHGFHVSSGDDTKVHRNSKGVWGTCTFHEYSARCPNRATTVRAHNWVVVGTLLAQDSRPWVYLPQTARLYCRVSQLPQHEDFQTKDQLLVEQFRQQARHIQGRHLAVFDGGYAHRGVIRGLVLPPEGQPRIEFVTRLRSDACLYELPQPQPPHKRGPKPHKGPALPKPSQVESWPEPWLEAKVFLYGRQRQVRYKTRICLWSVSGWTVRVRVVLAEVAGFSKVFTVVSSAVELTAMEILEVYAGRYRQEDGFRDSKQQLGWEEGRYWTKQPVLRTTQMTLVVGCLLRVLQWEVERRSGEPWWEAPPWYPDKKGGSIRDLVGLFRRHTEQIQRLLAEWVANP